jgi:hypothetical protein
MEPAKAGEALPKLNHDFQAKDREQHLVPQALPLPTRHSSNSEQNGVKAEQDRHSHQGTLLEAHRALSQIGQNQMVAGTQLLRQSG